MICKLIPYLPYYGSYKQKLMEFKAIQCFFKAIPFPRSYNEHEVGKHDQNVDNSESKINFP